MKKAPTVFGNKVVYAGMRANLKYHKARKAARLRKAAASYKDGKGIVRKAAYDLSMSPEEVKRAEALVAALFNKSEAISSIEPVQATTLAGTSE